MLKALVVVMFAAVAVGVAFHSGKHAAAAHKYKAITMRTSAQCPANGKTLCGGVIQGNVTTPAAIDHPAIAFFYLADVHRARGNAHCRAYSGSVGARFVLDGARVAYAPRLIADGKWHPFNLALPVKELAAGPHHLSIAEFGKSSVSFGGAHCANVAASNVVRIANVGFAGMLEGLTSGRSMTDTAAALQKVESH